MTEIKQVFRNQKYGQTRTSGIQWGEFKHSMANQVYNAKEIIKDKYTERCLKIIVNRKQVHNEVTVMRQ